MEAIVVWDWFGQEAKKKSARIDFRQPAPHEFKGTIWNKQKKIDYL